MRLRLVATAYRPGGGEGVLVAHTDGDAAVDAQAAGQTYKMEALGRLAGGVAHDFANMVTLISGYSDLLLNRIGEHDPSRPELEEIRRAAARSGAVTAQILDFVRKQANVPGLIQMNKLVAEMIRMLRPIIGEHITLVVSPDPNLGAVRADFAQMTRVVMNLVLNARDAMPKGGAIRIRTANLDGPAASWHRLPPGSYVMLEVSDTGTGMDADTLRQIFQPFFTTKSRGGTGLGLNTVQRILGAGRRGGPGAQRAWQQKHLHRLSTARGARTVRPPLPTVARAHPWGSESRSCSRRTKPACANSSSISWTPAVTGYWKRRTVAMRCVCSSSRAAR